MAASSARSPVEVVKVEIVGIDAARKEGVSVEFARVGKKGKRTRRGFFL